MLREKLVAAERTALLEDRVAALTQQNRLLELHRTREVQRQGEERVRMRQHTEAELKEMASKLEGFEQDVPLLRCKLKAEKIAFDNGNLVVSAARVAELGGRPQEQLSVVEHVQCAVFDLLELQVRTIPSLPPPLSLSLFALN